MAVIDWDQWAQLPGHQAVIDPRDELGCKNRLIDWIHWRAIRHVLEVSLPGRLLDYGCGNGRFADRLVSIGADYLGVDTSPGMIAAAKRDNPDHASRFAHVTGRALPFAAGHFDCVLTCMVLQYLVGTDDMDQMIGELTRVLRPGGQFIVLEQVSQSGRHSGSVQKSTTESGLRAALGKVLDVQSVVRIRAASFAPETIRALRECRDSPSNTARFLRSLDMVATSETMRIQAADSTYLSTLDYYDVTILARR